MTSCCSTGTTTRSPYAGFSWPRAAALQLRHRLVRRAGRGEPGRLALWVIDGDQETELTFAELADRSVAVAHFLLADLGLRRGDRLLLVLGNCVPLWEIMLGAIRLGAVVIPATPQLSAADLADRVERGDARLLVRPRADAERFADLSLPLGKLAVGGSEEPPHRGLAGLPAGDEFLGADRHLPGASKAGDPMLLYFTSGTTALPKLVEHTRRPTPSGTCRRCTGWGCSPATCTSTSPRPAGPSTPGATCSRPGWPGRPCWCYNYARFDPAELLEVLERTRGDHLLRAADGVADAGADRSGRGAPLPARGAVGRGAAQPRGDRAGPDGLGPDHPGRLRPDRDHRPGRQPARGAGQARLDGAAAARLPGGAGRPGHR